MITHIFFDTYIYAPNFARFIQQHPEDFPPDNHRVIFVDPPFVPVTSIPPDLKHVTLLSWPADHKVLSRWMAQSEKIIVHGLYNSVDFLVFLRCRPWHLKKVHWAIWGHDLHSYALPRNHWKAHVHEVLRKSIFRSIRNVIAWMPGDFDLAQRVYRMKARYHPVVYPGIVQLDFTPKDSSNHKGSRTIQVGNSADPANRHLELFDLLARMNLSDVNVFCPLSYGNMDYAKQVSEQGRKLFGDRFRPLETTVSLDEYMKMLSSVDLAIMNYRTQKGLGNAIILLSLGKKLYLPADTTPSRYFSEYLGLSIYDTTRLAKETDKTLFSFDAEKGRHNREVIRREYSDSRCAELWKAVFSARTL